MSSKEKTTRNSSGFSLLEVLVVLAVLSLALTVSLQNFRQPSDSMKLEQSVAGLKLAVAKARLAHSEENTRQTVDLKRFGAVMTDCRGGGVDVVIVPSQAHSSGLSFCMQLGFQKRFVTIDPVTWEVNVEHIAQ